MKKIYLIKLTDYDGDCSICWLDNEEWFNWINDFVPDPIDPTVGTYRSYSARYIPDSLVDYTFNLPKYMKMTRSTTKEELYKGLYKQMTPGSFENDKAIMLSTILSYDDKNDHVAPSSTKKLVKWLQENDYQIEDEYEGFIY